LKKRIIFDGLYAASIGYFDKLLSENGIEFDSIHMYHDVNFGGGMPEPKPQYMAEMIDYVKSHNGYVGFANDGDSDRFGVINENGDYVTPNEIIAILLKHLKKNKNYSGSLVKTVGGSLMLDIVAKKMDVEIIETPVGFKHVGEAMRKYNPIIAGEESGGLSIQGHIPEKDGILANLLVLEAMAYEKKTLVELQKELHEFVGCSFINTRVDKKLESVDEVKPTLDEFSALDDVAGMKVIRKDFKDGVKLYLEDEKTWILVRPSGTEPLLRIYIESDSQEKINNIKSLQGLS
jgi:phosphomannomutase